ncbi:DoxX family protein [Marinobacter sp. SBS5]|uniref:DoxX family protein n=1 Tax=Marinobacter sp. SBS5 TaxID=3401754 RepID=UPI003AADEE38
MNVSQKINGSIASMVSQPGVASVVSIVSRFLLAYIFLVSGYGKITGYEGTAGYMESMGVSAGLLPLVILAEIGGGIALLIGFQARLAALGLAVFSIAAAFIFHGADDMNQQIHFMKNLAIAGGLLVVFLNGAGKLSLDAESRT